MNASVISSPSGESDSSICPSDAFFSSTRLVEFRPVYVRLLQVIQDGNSGVYDRRPCHDQVRAEAVLAIELAKNSYQCRDLPFSISCVAARLRAMTAG
jgi:hypothetical protein